MLVAKATGSTCLRHRMFGDCSAPRPEHSHAPEQKALAAALLSDFTLRPLRQVLAQLDSMLRGGTSSASVAADAGNRNAC